MKIERKGVMISEVPGVDYIEVRPGEIILKLAGVAAVSFGVSETAQIRNALEAALEEHAKFDTAMTAPPVWGPGPGARLNGDESLPFGARVQDCEDRIWVYLATPLPRWVFDDDAVVDYTPRQLSEIVRHSGPVHLVSLP